MPGSVTSVFSEVEEFPVALRAEGRFDLFVTGVGRFPARLSRVNLHHLRLSAAAEPLARIVTVAVPADMILVSLVRIRASAPIWPIVPGTAWARPSMLGAGACRCTLHERSM